MLALSRSLDWRSDNLGKHCVSHNDVLIVYADTRCLIVNVKTRFLDVCVVCMHAPLLTSTDSTPGDFWKEHIPLVRKHAGSRAVVSFIDANCVAASSIDGRIGGDVLSGKTTVQGFEDYLIGTRSLFPATFADYGNVQPLTTYGTIDEWPWGHN